MHIKTISQDVKKRLRGRKKRFVILDFFSFLKCTVFNVNLDHAHVVIHHQEEIVVIDMKKNKKLS